MVNGQFGYLKSSLPVKGREEFLIMRKLTGSQFGYTVIATVYNEDEAKRIVTALLNQHGLETVVGSGR